MSVNISVTKAEYEAIMFALDQINDAIEGATDDDYIKKAIAASKLINNVHKKIKNAGKTNE